MIICSSVVRAKALAVAFKKLIGSIVITLNRPAIVPRAVPDGGCGTADEDPFRPTVCEKKPRKLLAKKYYE